MSSLLHFVSGFFNQCSCGGRCLSIEYTDRVGELAKKHGLKLHIDGARIFNAAVVSKIFFNIFSYESHLLLYDMLSCHIKKMKEDVVQGICQTQHSF